MLINNRSSFQPSMKNQTGTRLNAGRKSELISAHEMGTRVNADLP